MPVIVLPREERSINKELHGDTGVMGAELSIIVAA
jgi:hypothetical protein